MNTNSIKIFVQNHWITIEPNNQSNENLSKNEVHQLLELPDYKTIYHYLPEKYLAELCKTYLFIEAAGGIVVYKQPIQWLMIFRRGYWDLPKGKIDEGEHPLSTAKRELFEETGINVNNTPSTFIDVTYHFYKNHEQIVLKRTYWYMFFVEDLPSISLQYDEDIEKAQWINKESWSSIKSNTYASIAYLLQQTNLV